MSNEETHKSKSKLALAVIASAQLMIVLDITIVNVALPSIQRALSFSTSSLAWVVDAYTLVFGGLLLLGGRSGDIFGRRKMFTVGVLLFAGASLLGGLASSSALDEIAEEEPVGLERKSAALGHRSQAAVFPGIPEGGQKHDRGWHGE